MCQIKLYLKCFKYLIFSLYFLQDFLRDSHLMRQISLLSLLLLLNKFPYNQSCLSNDYSDDVTGGVLCLCLDIIVNGSNRRKDADNDSICLMVY